MRRSEFEVLVEDALRGLPEMFREKMENILTEVRDRPTVAMLADLGLEPGETLLGLYQGVPLPARTAEEPPLLPDRILLFQEPIEQSARSRADLVWSIQDTVIHEVGHFFGLSDEVMGEIERERERRLERGRGRGPVRRGRGPSDPPVGN
ncbi:MAG: metallopeptidase family protein [Planctomycetes bacterium]|nr:metallopeptidase family protein [Planctomycetota bacterium]